MTTSGPVGWSRSTNVMSRAHVGLRFGRSEHLFDTWQLYSVYDRAEILG